MSQIKNQLPKAFIRGGISPASLDKEARTMEVVFSQGTKGLRSSWIGDYYEELEVTESAVRLDRLKNNAPVLKDHRASIDNVIGVVESARIEGGEGIAKVRFSDNPNHKAVIDDIMSGIIRKISVGYFVHRYEEVAAPKGEPPTYRATDWEPVEVSFVAVPFDDKAQARDNSEFSSCEFQTMVRGLNQVEENLEQPAPSAASEVVAPVVEEVAAPVEVPAPVPVAEVVPAPESPVALDAAQVADRALATEKESKRVRSILELAHNAGLSVKDALAIADEGHSVEKAREIVLERWANRGNNNVELETRIEVGADLQKNLFQRGIGNALLNRFDSKANPLTEEGRHFRGLSMLDMAKEMLESGKVSTRGQSKLETAKMIVKPEVWNRAGFHSTSDFPHLLADVANKTLRQSYEQAPKTFMEFVRIVQAADFKNINRMALGEAPSLSEVGEHGETTYGTMGESKETYRIKRYARIFALTYEAMVNDDLDAFTRAPQLLGRSAANLESDLVYAVLTANAAMGDGIALFHSSHGNVGSTAAISDTTLGEMRKLGRKQTGIDGSTLLNIMYKYLVVPAAIETAAQKQLSLIVPNASSSVNPFTNLYKLIVEPRLDANSATAWYGIADPAQIDTIELAYLAGQESVFIDSEIDFDTRGMKLRAEHAVAAKAIDWRGMFKNAGA